MSNALEHQLCFLKKGAAVGVLHIDECGTILSNQLRLETFF